MHLALRTKAGRAIQCKRATERLFSYDSGEESQETVTGTCIKEAILSRFPVGCIKQTNKAGSGTLVRETNLPTYTPDLVSMQNAKLCLLAPSLAPDSYASGCIFQASFTQLFYLLSGKGKKKKDWKP